MSKIKVVSMNKLTGEAASEPKPSKTSNPPKKPKTIADPQPSTSSAAIASDAAPKKKSKSKSLDVILEGIKQLNDRKGVSLISIKKFVISGKENMSEQQIRIAGSRTLKMVKQAVEDGLLVKKGTFRYGFTDKGRTAVNSEKKKAEKALKKKEKEAAKDQEKKQKMKAKAKAKDAGGKKKKNVEEKKKKKGSGEKQKPLIKGPKGRKSLAKVAELNKKRRSTVVVLPKKAPKKAAVKSKK